MVLKKISTFKMYIRETIMFVFCLTLLGIDEVVSDRQLSYTVNPGCPLPECKNGSITLIHVKAIGSNDVLHHIWDFSGKPTVLLALTETNATLDVNWSGYAFGNASSVAISPQPTYTYGVVLDKILEFNDENNEGILNKDYWNNASYISTLDPKNFDWKVKQMFNESGKVLFILEGSNYSDAAVKKNGSVQVMMSAFAGADHGELLPRLLHSGNASQMEIVLDKFSTQYANSRFGLRLITTSTDSANNTVDIKGRQTLDDEHAPGVFNIVEMMTPGAAGESTLGGYLQWRPVVYLSPERDMTNSTESIQYLATNVQDSLATLNRTLLYTLFGYKLSDMLVVETNVTFGVSGDGFYRKSNYAVWTLLAGYGHPPMEKFSMLVTLVLSIGLGLPALLIVVGAACIFIRRLTRNKDDLFLSR